jgi:hypothetical protein
MTKQSTPDQNHAGTGPEMPDAMKMTTVPDLERRMVSFTPGTRISTRKGLVAVENLEVDDEVITRERGYQPIRWIGSSQLTAAELNQNPQLQPVLVRKGALGKKQPLCDTLLNPNQRILIINAEDDPHDAPEGLVAISALQDRDGVERVAASDVTYIHLVFDLHPVVMGDGVWSDSFQPGNTKARHKSDRGQVVDLFPELTPMSTNSETVCAQAAAEKEYAQRLSGQSQE